MIRSQTNPHDAGKGLRVSFEFFPPKTDAMAARLWETVERLEPMAPDFVSVTYGAGGSTRERTHAIVKRMAEETTLRPAGHITCVAATKDEIDQVLRDYWAAGVKRIVALRGDPTDGIGTRYVPHPGGYAYASDHTSATAIYVMTHFRLDTLVTGGVLAIAWRTPALRLRLEQHAGKVALALLAIIGAWLVGKAGLNWPSWSAAQQAGGYSLIAIFFAALHVLSLRLSPSSTIYRVLSSYPAIQLGKLSYGIYLFHLPLEVVARNLGYHPKLQVAAAQTAWPTVVGYTLANAAVATLAAWLTWNLFEKHVLRLKDYFTYRKSAAK